MNSRIHSNILSTIGRTPVVRLNRIVGANNATIFAKCEFFNPLSSVKDRLCYGLITEALKDGSLKPGQTVVEATSGNTGIGLAMVCAALGHPLVITMAESFSIERRKIMRALGAKVVLTPAAEKGTGMIQKAVELAAEHDFYLPSQFSNPNNFFIHAQTTASELLSDFAGEPLDYFVNGYGTGGTFSGVAAMMRVARPSVKLALSEPDTAPMVASGEEQPRDGALNPVKSHPAFTGPHPIQGWAPDFLPFMLEQGVERTPPDMVVSVSGAEAMAMSARLAKEEGIFTGISGGGSVASALKVAEQDGRPDLKIVTVLADTQERYISGPLYEKIPAEMDEAEIKLSKSTPVAQLSD